MEKIGLKGYERNLRNHVCRGEKKKKKGMRCLVVPVPKLEIADEGSRSKANKSWRFLM